MLHKFWYAFAQIFNRDRIPKLPRGMLASAYDDVPGIERRVMARVGARDPTGVKRAMKRYGVNTVEELIALLEHQKPRRNIWHRIKNGIGRVVGGETTPPHREELLRDMRRSKHSKANLEIKKRVNEMRKVFK